MQKSTEVLQIHLGSSGAIQLASILYQSTCTLQGVGNFISVIKSVANKMRDTKMSELEKQMLRNQKNFTEDMLRYMKQHDQRLQRIEQYSLQLVSVFNQASECLHDV